MHSQISPVRSSLTLDYLSNCFDHIVSVRLHCLVHREPGSLPPSLYFLFGYAKCCCHCVTNGLGIVAEIKVTFASEIPVPLCTCHA